MNNQSCQIKISSLFEQYLSENKDKYTFIGNQYYPIDFVEKFQDKFNTNMICHFRIGPLLEKYLSDNKDKYTFIGNQHYAIEFVEMFEDKLDWEWISWRRNLSEAFIEKFQDKVDWDVLLDSDDDDYHAVVVSLATRLGKINPGYVVANEVTNDVCGICRCDQSEDNVKLQCSHLFHEGCIKQWLDRLRLHNKTCPLCRQKV